MTVTPRPNWLQDLNTIASIQFRDKLAVREGKLVITPAGFTQGIIRTVSDIVYGGYNRRAVADHCTKLMDEFQNKLANDALPQGVSSYRELRDVINAVKTSFSNIEYSYRSSSALSSDSRPFSILFSRTTRFLEGLEKKVEPLQQKPPINYDAPVDAERISLTMPEGYIPEDITKLATSARKHIIPTWKKIAAHAIFWLSPLVAFLTVVPLTPFKWVIWDPLEYILRGRVTSMSPFTWYADNVARFIVQYTGKNAEHAIGRYAHQLLDDRMITKDHLHAFRSLVKDYFQIKGRYPGVADLSTMQITSEPDRQRSITLEDFKELLRIFADEPSCRGIHIPYFMDRDIQTFYEVLDATKSDAKAEAAAKIDSDYVRICNYLDELGFKPKGEKADSLKFIRKS